MNGFVRTLAAAHCILALAAAPAQSQNVARGPFVAYETLEMSMNGFSNFAGEIGWRFSPKYQARLTVMEVSLTERHLASGWESGAVEGRNVTGYLRGYELHADRYLGRHVYASANAGWYQDTYEHTASDARLRHSTPTAGLGLGYSRTNLFGVPRLHVDLSLPVRYYFRPIEETRLGESTVRKHVVVNNVWLFVGIKL